MGGARCSYQNCSQKSDKKTHMFHYPVFEKLRCHQWIINAQKLNYLDLKLSQLKNRMVCEHHFTDDCFMNVMKNKLKNNAIPTEDGPYSCKTFKEEGDEAQGIKDELPINIDDIENEFTPTTDRRAHLSVKYGDFLTNDVTDSITLTPDYKSTSIMLKDKGLIFNRFDRKTRSHYNQRAHSNVKKITNITRVNHAIKKKSDSSSTCEIKSPDPKVVAIEFNELDLSRHEINPSKSIPSTPQKRNFDQVTTIKTPTSIPLSKKVRIISERHLSEPVKIPPGELQPVSPSIVIKVPDKKKKSNIEIDGKEIKTFYVDESQNLQLTKNVPVSESSIMVYTHTPLDTATDQMHLNAYPKPTICVDQIGLNNVAIQNADPLVDIKPIDYLSSEANLNSQQLEPGTGLFTIIEDMTSAPNLEFVSGSLTGPSVFTLTDVPQVSNRYQKPMVTDSIYMENVNQAPQNVLSSMDPETLAANQDHVSSMSIKTVSDTLGISENMAVGEKPMLKNSPNKSMTRHKMPPEKLAAIEQKRKYNMKLRDIINSCLNNMDEEPDVSKLTAAMKNELSNKKVGEYLTKDSSQPQSQENIIAYFETRLQRMEDNLLNKIEQNSHKIIDLKQMVKKQTSVKKSTSTQTYFSAEATKRTLYEQVSQYLTPDLNSLIYEELFINLCVSKTEPKKRKRRSNNDK